MWSLLGLLNLKSSVRQRRVMLDLIYVNVIIVLFDFLVVTLLYLNRVGISHPIQTFSYALKFRLEFVVLNQLMAVAARGLQRETFEERRYHHSSVHDAFSAECRQWDENRTSGARKEHHDIEYDSTPKSLTIDSAQLSVPEPVLSRGSQPRNQSTKDSKFCGYSNMSEDIFGAEQGLRLENFLNDDSASSNTEKIDQIRAPHSQTFSGETLQPRGHLAPGDSSSHIYRQHWRDVKSKALGSIRHAVENNISHDAGHRRQPTRATIKRHLPQRGRNSSEEEEEEEEAEVGIHM